MRFGLLYELQLPRPWTEDSEYNLIHDSIHEVEAADRLGFDYIWANEHHFLEEYSHSSAPEVFLAACAARTQQIRIGHAVVLALPGYNHPARVAERLGMLDLVADGRVDWGTGESASRTELEGFGIDTNAKKPMMLEAVEQTANMMAMEPYPGFEGQYFSMPCRNLVPKPRQKPHPPLWMACSRRESIHMAARLGMGVLAFAFVDVEEAGRWAKEYYDIIKSDECVPIGHTVNANIAVVTGFSCHEDEDEAKKRGLEGFQFFGYSLGHYYLFGSHKPGSTVLWDRFNLARSEIKDVASSAGIGTPAQIRDRLREYQDVQIDQMIFIQQSGNTSRQHILEAMELFAREVLPEFRADRADREARKQEELRPYIEAALARKQRMTVPDPDRIEPIVAYGKTIAQQNFETKAGEETTRHVNAGLPVFLEDLAEKKAVPSV